VNTIAPVQSSRTEPGPYNSRTFAGTTGFVTGGGTGIGRAAALALAAEGCAVTVAGRTARTLEDTVRAVIAAGGSADYVICDVADENAVASAVRAALGNGDRLDFAVNCAGIDGDAIEMTAEYPTAKFDRIIATNVRGVFLSMKYELHQMAAQGFGAIVNVSSGAGLVGVPGFAAYSASKWAELGMTKSAALEYANRGIRINAICPGLVETPLWTKTVAVHPEEADRLIRAHPIGRIAKASEIADAIVWLCSNQSSFVVGAALPIDGGYTAQ
jgi:NAD(P)-dependent dehydrogenase (short-subunit alcohol dehydrogenase family)